MPGRNISVGTMNIPNFLEQPRFQWHSDYGQKYVVPMDHLCEATTVEEEWSLVKS